MNKDLKQMSHVKPYSCSSKKIAILSFLTALQVSSCVSGRSQGFLKPLVSNIYTDLSLVSEGSPGFKELQAKTVDMISGHFANSNAQLVKSHAEKKFFRAIEKIDLKEVKFLLEHPYITSKEVVKALRLALEYKDTLSFRYKHKAIVDFLLRECTLSPDDLCAEDEQGRTLLDLVIQRGDIDTVQFLVGKLPLEGLCTKDNKGRTPMHLAARYKSKTMFRVLFARIYELDSDRAIKELFKKGKNGYSVIESSYLRKDRDFAALWNNSHIQLPTFCRKGSEMFKFILNSLPVPPTLDQLVTIAIGIEEVLEGKTIYKGYAATLRSILKRYIKEQYDNNADKVIWYVAYKKCLPYIEKKYGSTSEEVQEYRDYYKRLVADIKKQYGSKYT